MQQGSQLGTVTSAHPVGPCKTLPQCQEPVLPVIWRAAIGTPNRLLLALCSALFEDVDDEGEEERHGKNGDKEVHDQPEVGRHTSAQTLYPGKQALPEPGRTLTGI